MFIDRSNSERDDNDSMSSGSMSPDLSVMWHQGPPMSPHWEGGLELNFDNTTELGTDREIGGRYDETVNRTPSHVTFSRICMHS